MDVDLSRKMFDSVLVERMGCAFPVAVQYLKQPVLCSHCKMLGHSLQSCRKLSYVQVNEGFNNVRRKGNTHIQKDHVIPAMQKQARLTQLQPIVSCPQIKLNSSDVRHDVVIPILTHNEYVSNHLNVDVGIHSEVAAGLQVMTATKNVDGGLQAWVTTSDGGC